MPQVFSGFEVPQKSAPEKLPHFFEAHRVCLLLQDLLQSCAVHLKNCRSTFFVCQKVCGRSGKLPEASGTLPEASETLPEGLGSFQKLLGSFRKVWEASRSFGKS